LPLHFASSSRQAAKAGAFAYVAHAPDAQLAVMWREISHLQF